MLRASIYTPFQRNNPPRKSDLPGGIVCQGFGCCCSFPVQPFADHVRGKTCRDGNDKITEGVHVHTPLPLERFAARPS